MNKKRFRVKKSDFKVSTSTSQGCDWCVEVARTRKGVAVRDSKNRTAGTLFFTNNEWAAFVNGVKGDEFNPLGPIAKRLKG